MYKVSIFNQQLEPVDFSAISDKTTIVEDYLSLANYSITVPKIVECESGYFIHITDENNRTVADALVNSVIYDKRSTELSVSSLLSLFDTETVNTVNSMTGGNATATGTAISINCTETWLVGTITRLLNVLGIPNSVTWTTATAGINEYDGKETANIVDVISLARSVQHINVQTQIQINPRVLKIVIGVNNGRSVIDSDLGNVISREINVSTGEGHANICKAVMYKEEDKLITETAETVFYRHSDGSINTSSVNPILPMLSVSKSLKYDDKITEEENAAKLADLAYEALTVGKYENEIRITMRADDLITGFSEITANVEALISARGISYLSILQGFERTGNIVTYLFGNVRTDLTSILAIERRKK